MFNQIRNKRRRFVFSNSNNAEIINLNGKAFSIKYIYRYLLDVDLSRQLHVNRLSLLKKINFW